MAERLARDEAGNIWVVDASGNPVRLHQPGGGPNVVVPVAPDPKLPGAIQGQQLSNVRAQQQINEASQTAPFDYRKAVADAARAEADAREAAAKAAERDRLEKAKSGADSESVRELATIINNLDRLQLDATDNGGWFETGFSGATMRSTPGSAAYDLKGRVTGIQGAQLIDKLLQLKQQSDTGATGFGSLTEKEVELILSSIANLDPNQSQDLFLENLNQARDAALAGYRRAGGKDPAVDPSLKEETDKTPPMVGGDQPQDKVGFSGDGYRDEIDPVLKGVAGRLGKMVSAGASDATIMEFLAKNGVDPANTNIKSVLQHRRTPEYKAWQRANPGKAYPIGPDFYTNKIPLTPAQNLGNMAAQSSPGAAAIGFAQGATGNRLDDFANFVGGNGDAINTGIQLSRANSPTASFLGDVGGQAFAQYALNKVPGFRALPNSAPGRVAEDAIYGAYAGHGEGNTLGGMASNVLGGGAARVGSGAIGTAVRGINDPSLRYLHREGVDLTPGRIARGTGGTVGDIVARGEERLAGLPVTESIINSARREGDLTFNQAAFRQAQAPFSLNYKGNVGGPGLQDLNSVKSQAYSFLDPLQFPIDAKFAGTQAGIRSRVPGLVDLGDKVTSTLNTIDNSFDSGILSGPRFQQDLRTVRSARSGAARENFGYEASGLLNEAEGNLYDLAARNSPDVARNLGIANEVYRNRKVLGDAVSASPSQRAGELFSPQTLNQASNKSQRLLKLDPNSPARPFYDLTKAGMEVMPNMTPDSGTMGRALFASALGGATLGGVGGGGYGAASDDVGAAQGAGLGAGGGAALGVSGPLLLAALYSKPVRTRVAKTLLSDRPKWMKDLDKAIDANPYLRKIVSKRAAGMFGSAAARDLTLYPELEQ